MVLNKLKLARKDKGYSHENMTIELGISQAAYTNIEKNKSNLSVERLIRLSEILGKPIYYFFEAMPSERFNKDIPENSINSNSYATSKEFNANEVYSYEMVIKNLKEEVSFLRPLVKK